MLAGVAGLVGCGFVSGSRGAGRGLASIWMRAGFKPGAREKLNHGSAQTENLINRKLTRWRVFVFGLVQNGFSSRAADCGHDDC